MKFIISFLMVLGLISCGVGCKDAPPRYAEYIEGGGHGMVHHFRLYDVVGDAQMNNPTKCTNYSYVQTDMYVDSLGDMNIGEIIWIDSNNRTIYPTENSDMINVRLSMQQISINGFDYNGGTHSEYPVR